MTGARTDREGPEQTYVQHRRTLLRLAYLMCGSRELSEDIVQSSFASAQTRWESIDDPVAYLRRAVVNQAKDAHRRSHRWKTFLATQPRVEPVTHNPELDETWAVVASLGSMQRAVVVLHYYADLPLVEIAELLDRPASTVRSDLRRAHDVLRKALS
jgi:RNA polymerase sigma factor (sigma-70 family)